MKKLDLTDTLECSVQDFWKLWFTPGFIAALDREAQYKSVQVLLNEDTAEKTHLRRRITPGPELPPHIKMALNNSLSMLRQALGSVNVQTLPEMFRKLVGWAQVAFQDHLEPKDGKKPDIVMTYVEDQVFDKKKQVLKWSITPDLFKDFSAFRGTTRIEPAEAGIKRVIAGEFDLGIPGVGDMVEGWVVQEIEKIFKKVPGLVPPQLQAMREGGGSSTTSASASGSTAAATASGSTASATASGSTTSATASGSTASAAEAFSASTPAQPIATPTQSVAPAAPTMPTYSVGLSMADPTSPFTSRS